MRVRIEIVDSSPPSFQAIPAAQPRHRHSATLRRNWQTSTRGLPEGRGSFGGNLQIGRGPDGSGWTFFARNMLYTADEAHVEIGGENGLLLSGRVLRRDRLLGDGAQVVIPPGPDPRPLRGRPAIQPERRPIARAPVLLPALGRVLPELLPAEDRPVEQGK